MNASERLDNARADVEAGQYEEALRGYIWFHDHALEERRSLYGVRLSYALDEWVELGRIYPPAMHELKTKRDEKSARLGRGEGDRGLFHDVEAINEYLADYGSTYDLFVRLMGSNKDLADKCADLAVPAIVKSKDFVLARRMLQDPERSVRNWSKTLNEDVADLATGNPPHAEARLGAYIHYYATQVQLILDVLNGAGEPDFARKLRADALAFVESASVMNAVKDALSRPAEM